MICLKIYIATESCQKTDSWKPLSKNLYQNAFIFTLQLNMIIAYDCNTLILKQRNTYWHIKTRTNIVVEIIHIKNIASSYSKSQFLLEIYTVRYLKSYFLNRKSAMKCDNVHVLWKLNNLKVHYSWIIWGIMYIYI